MTGSVHPRPESQDSVVFVVDDDASTLKALTSTIAADGWKVRSFSTPESFLDGHDPDCHVNKHSFMKDGHSSPERSV